MSALQLSCLLVESRSMKQNRRVSTVLLRPIPHQHFPSSSIPSTTNRLYLLQYGDGNDEVARPAEGQKKPMNADEGTESEATDDIARLVGWIESLVLLHRTKNYLCILVRYSQMSILNYSCEQKALCCVELSVSLSIIPKYRYRSTAVSNKRLAGAFCSDIVGVIEPSDESVLRFRLMFPNNASSLCR